MAPTLAGSWEERVLRQEFQSQARTDSPRAGSLRRSDPWSARPTYPWCHAPANETLPLLRRVGSGMGARSFISLLLRPGSMPIRGNAGADTDCPHHRRHLRRARRARLTSQPFRTSQGEIRTPPMGSDRPQVDEAGLCRFEPARVEVERLEMGFEVNVQPIASSHLRLLGSQPDKTCPDTSTLEGSARLRID